MTWTPPEPRVTWRQTPCPLTTSSSERRQATGGPTEVEMKSPESRKGARLRDSWRRGNCMTAGLRGYSLHPGQLLLWTESESSEEEVRDRGGSASHNQGNLDTHTLNWQTISSQSSFPGSFNYSLHTDSTF